MGGPSASVIVVQLPVMAIVVLFIVYYVAAIILQNRVARKVMQGRDEDLHDSLDYQIALSREGLVRKAVWEAITPSVLKQDDPTATQFWYRDTDPFRPGDLAIWVDPQGHVVRFQIAYTPAIGYRQRFASWHVGGQLHTGVILDDAPWRSPLVRPWKLTEGEFVALRDYVDTMDKVPPEQRAAVLSRLPYDGATT